MEVTSLTFVIPAVSNSLGGTETKGYFVDRTDRGCVSWDCFLKVKPGCKDSRTGVVLTNALSRQSSE